MLSDTPVKDPLTPKFPLAIAFRFSLLELSSQFWSSSRQAPEKDLCGEGYGIPCPQRRKYAHLTPWCHSCAFSLEQSDYFEGPTGSIRSSQRPPFQAWSHR